MLKIEENPPILYPEKAEIAEISGRWWVAHTKSRNEKALAWSLRQWEIAYFLPMREKVTVSKGRKFTSIMPLFGGYVFFSGDIESRYRAMTTNRVAQVIEVVDQAGLINQMSQIHKALLKGVRLDPHPYLKEGALCRVTAGPLKGMEGILVQKKNVVKIVLKMDILGQAAAVEIDADLVEQIE